MINELGYYSAHWAIAESLGLRGDSLKVNNILLFVLVSKYAKEKVGILTNTVTDCQFLQ